MEKKGHEEKLEHVIKSCIYINLLQYIINILLKGIESLYSYLQHWYLDLLTK